MKLLALSDIHSPRYTSKLREVLEAHVDLLSKIDLVLIAGDLTHKGSLRGFDQLRQLLEKYFQGKPVIACPGNEDFDQIIPHIRRCSALKLLDDEEIALELCGYQVRIYGTRGVLDKPTVWQQKNIKNIEQIYAERLQKLAKIIQEVSSTENKIFILLSHYALTYATLEGEDRKIWQHLGTNKLEKYFGKNMLLIHGHAHKSVKRYVVYGKTHIVNVAFPGVEGVFYIEYNGVDNVNVKLLRKDSVEQLKPETFVYSVGESTSTSQQKFSRSILDFLQ